MFLLDQLETPVLGHTGLDGVLTPEAAAVQQQANRFAREVMRPLGRKIDLMTAEQSIAPESPIWEYIKVFRESGLMDLEALEGVGASQKAEIMSVVFEELGWGDSGLALLGLVTSFPSLVAQASGKSELAERFSNSLGCWVGTQPDRGGDAADMDVMELKPGCAQSRGNLLARKEGSNYVINGQTSSWVSAGPIAEVACAIIPCDYGDGVRNDRGGLHQICMLIPLDQKGVSKGKPLEKLGQRPLPQGEIFFDDVVVPDTYVIASREKVTPFAMGQMTFANMEMAATFTGVARAAFDHALSYVHERKQGGAKIIEHQAVRLRVFDMWRRLEAGRALARRVFDYNYGPLGPHVLASFTSKTYCTQMAVEVTNEAMTLFGGYGLTKEYPVEKLMRDAKASLIEDGENTLLSLKGAQWLSRWHLKNTH